jgi:hypothetical protein
MLASNVRRQFSVAFGAPGDTLRQVYRAIAIVGGLGLLIALVQRPLVLVIVLTAIPAVLFLERALKDRIAPGNAMTWPIFVAAALVAWLAVLQPSALSPRLPQSPTTAVATAAPATLPPTALPTPPPVATAAVAAAINPTPDAPPAIAAVAPTLAVAPTASPVPLDAPVPATAAAAPEVAPTVAPSGVQITSVRGGLVGGFAQVVAQTAPAASCAIAVVSPLGTAGRIRGLKPQTADSSGQVSWTWVINPRTQPGQWQVQVQCDNLRATAPLTIQPGAGGFGRGDDN